jgi:hypothetical protein
MALGEYAYVCIRGHSSKVGVGAQVDRRRMLSTVPLIGDFSISSVVNAASVLASVVSSSRRLFDLVAVMRDVPCEMRHCLEGRE